MVGPELLCIEGGTPGVREGGEKTIRRPQSETLSKTCR